MIEGAQSADIASSSIRATFTEALQSLRALVVLTNLDHLMRTLDVILATDRTRGVGVSGEITDLLPELASLARESSGWPQVALSRGLLGIAATGGVVVAEPHHRDRLTALLADKHVVLLPADALVPSLADVAPILRRWTTQEGRRYVTIVSGPSRTSDIERVLTLGAHGPRELIVVLVEAWTPDHA
jgi:L-lactate dehydrogenase complex protein LldG